MAFIHIFIYLYGGNIHKSSSKRFLSRPTHLSQILIQSLRPNRSHNFSIRILIALSKTLRNNKSIQTNPTLKIIRLVPTRHPHKRHHQFLPIHSHNHRPTVIHFRYDGLIRSRPFPRIIVKSLSIAIRTAKPIDTTYLQYEYQVWILMSIREYM